MSKVHLGDRQDALTKTLPADAVVVVSICGQSNIYGTASWLSTIGSQPGYGEPRSLHTSVPGAQKPLVDIFEWDKQKRINWNEKNSLDPYRTGLPRVHQFRNLTIGWGAGGTAYPWEDGSGGPSSGEYSDPGSGCELMLAHRLRLATRRPVYIIKFAEGGTSITKPSASGSSHTWNVNEVGTDDSLFEIWRDYYWHDAIDNMVNTLGINLSDIHVAGQVWFQGAADMNNLNAANAYEANLKDLLDVTGSVDGFRKTMNSASPDSVPVCIVRSEDYVVAQHQYFQTVRTAQETVQAGLANSGLADIDTCEREDYLGDPKGEHMTLNGQHEMGNLIAEQLLAQTWMSSPEF